MNIDEVLSGVQILNPNYSKSKKNPQPRYITTRNPNVLANSLANNLGDGTLWSGINLNYTRPEEQEERGITPNRTIADPQRELAEEQSTASKWGNAIAQTVVSEIGLGTAKAFSDIVDFIGSKIFYNNDDYSNPVSAQLEKWQEDFRNYAPIYTDPDVDIFNGGLGNAGWWASNVPSIASSLTLLIPSTALTKGLGLIGKALNTNRRINSFTRKAVSNLERWTNRGKPWTLQAEERAALFGKVGTNALLQRTMENYQEARGVYQDMYTEASNNLNEMDDAEYAAFINKNKNILGDDIDYTDKDAVAKAIAKRSADVDFRNNYVNTIFDVFQLYALRNIFGKGQLSERGTVASRRAQRESIRYAGKTPDEIEKLKAQRSFWDKTKDNVGDYLVGGSLAIKAELSEGVEEAINYISQEEGMNTGRLLFGEGNKSAFDRRLATYMQNPQIWESAFWGVLGGVVFQGAGSGLMKVQQTINDRLDEKDNKNKDNATTKERKIQASWKGLSELPEVQRRVKDIESRSEKLNMLSADLKELNQGYALNQVDENGNKIQLDDVQKEAAIQNRKDKYITDITLQAIQNGNYDLLEQYFASDEVRQAMVEQGIVTQQESTQWQQELLRKMKDVRTRYADNIRRLNAVSRNIEDTDRRISVEAIQLAASDNVWRELSIGSMTQAQQTYFDQYQRDKQAALENGKLDTTVDYEQALRLQVTAQELVDLYSSREEILNDIKNEGEDLAKRLSLNEVENRIKRLQTKLFQERSANSLADALYVMGNVTGFGQRHFTNRDAVKQMQDIDKQIIKAVEGNDFSGLFSSLGITDATNSLEEVDFDSFKGRYNSIRQSTREAILGRNGINKIGQGVADSYRAYLQLQYEIDNLRNQMIYTREELTDYVGMVNNTLDEGRRNAIKEASKTIEDLFDKYGRAAIETAITADYQGNQGAFNTATQGFTQQEKDNLSTALKILNFSNPSNTSLYGRLEQMFEARERMNNARNKTENERTDNSVPEQTDTNTEGTQSATQEESSTTIQNPPQATETSQVDNSSAAITETATAQENGQQANAEQQPTFQPTQTSGQLSANIIVDADGNTSIVATATPSDTSVQLVPIEGEEGTFELVTGQNAWGNRALFDVDKQASVIDGNAKVQSNPKVRRNNNNGQINYGVVEKGVIVPINEPDNTTPVEESDATQPAATSQQETTPSPASAPAPAPTSAPSPDAQPSSTGVVNPSSSREDYVISDVDVVTDISVKANADVIPFIKSRKDAGQTLTIDDLIDYLREKYTNDGYDEVALNEVLEKIKNNPLYNKLINTVNKSVQAVGDVLNSTIVENSKENTNVLSEEYSRSADNLFKVFNDQADPIVVNGKYYFRFEDLLRFCNEQAGDPNIARDIYSLLKNYIQLRSQDPNYPYRIVENIIQSDVSILEDAARPLSENIARRLGEAGELRVSVQDLIDSITDPLAKSAIYKELDSLNPNDELQISSDGGGISILHNGVQIGALPRPHVSADNPDTYLVYNDGILYDVNISNGESRLKDLLISWINEETDDGAAINEILYDLAYGHPTTENITNAINRLKQIKEFSQLPIRTNDVITEEDSNNRYNEVVNGLVKLWRYTARNYNLVQGDISTALTRSIDAWFNKLGNTYATIDAMVSNPNNFTVKVSRIGKPQLAVKYDYKDSKFDNNEAKQNSPNIKDALSPASRANFQIGFVPVDHNKYGFANTTSVKVTNGTTIDMNSAVGQTFGVIYDRQGNSYITRIYNVGINDGKLGEQAKQIVTAIKQELTRRINDYANAKPGSGQALKEFISALWSNGKNRASGRGLFSGNIVINDLKNGNFNIAIKGQQRAISFIFNNYNGRPQFKYSVRTGADYGGFKDAMTETGRNEITDFLNSLLDIAEFDLNFDVLQHEYNKNYPVSGFYHTDSNGNLYIEIPNSSEDGTATRIDIPSYKDFLVDNGMLKINLDKRKDYDGNDTNFIRHDEQHSLGNQHLYITISQNQVQTNDNTNQTNITTRSQETIDSIFNVINSKDKRKHKGKEIAKILLGNNPAINRLTRNVSRGISILPKDIKFDDKLTTIAHYDPKDPEHPFVVGKKWIDLVADPTTKAQAVRKLIHEQLHYLLNTPDSAHYRQVAFEIRNRFREYINDNEDKYPIGSTIRGYLFDELVTPDGNADKAVEEFLVESITSRELIDVLNEIDYQSDDNTQRSKSLFQKIIELLSQVFNWPIREGSLYEYEFQQLGDLINSTPEAALKVENEVNTTTPVEESNAVEAPTETPTTQNEETAEDEDSNPFDNMDFDNSGDGFDSSLYEYGHVPSIGSLIDSSPVEQQAKIEDLIDNAQISVSCKL